jgi:hypothetical protein
VFTSTARQNDADGHDTELRERVGSMPAGAPHVPSFYVTDFPLLSTATQNDADGHDTELRERVGSMPAGAPHVLLA